MKIQGNFLREKLSKHKLLVLFLFISLLITLGNVWYYKPFLFRSSPVAASSVLSKDFFIGCVQCFLLWMYLTLVFCVTAHFIRFIFCNIKKLVLSVKNGSLPPQKLLLYIAAFILAIFLAFLAEYIWGHLIIASPTTTGAYFNRYRFLFFLCSALIVYFIILFARRVIARFEHLFLILMLILGCCYTFGLPIGNISWDEAIHYQRAQVASHLSYCPTSEAEFRFMSGKVPATFHINEIDDIMDELDSVSDKNVMPGIRSYRQYIYQYASYVPAGLAMGICRLLHTSVFFMLYMGRFANLITYALLVYWAMKHLRSGKAILAAVAMFPTNMFVACTFSYDWFITAMCMLGFCCLVGELQRPEEKISRKNALLMVFVFFLGIGTKAIYFPMILLCLFLPATKFSSRKAYRRFRLLVIGATVITLISFALPFLVSSGASGTDTRGGSDVNAAEQVKYALTHPFTYCQTLLRFLKDYLSVEKSSNYTNSFAYLGSAHHATAVMMLLTAACFTDHNEADSTVLNKRFRITTISISAITMILFVSAMYAAFTDVGLDTINGCQPRYLAPLIFPVVFCIGSSKLRSKVSEQFQYSAFALGGSFILMASIWEMCIMHYS